MFKFNKRAALSIPVIALLGFMSMGADGGGCGGNEAVSSSGLKKATIHVPTGGDGLSSEQRNVGQRVLDDNKPGAIKHLYIVSAYSGQVLLYSTVREKVSSSGKRLSPKTVESRVNNSSVCQGFIVEMGGEQYCTKEVLGDDGTYGDSIPYLYWYDSAGNYQQYYVSGGAIPIVSSKPLHVNSVVINMEMVAPQGSAPPTNGAPAQPIGTPR